MPPSNRKDSGDMFVATDSFTADLDGTPVAVVRGVTRVRAGHPLLQGREALFKRIEPHYEWPAPGRSGETRG